MKLISITLLFSLFALVAATSSGVLDERAAVVRSSSARTRFKLPKLLNFGQFKQLFNKKYGSLVENLSRAKLYLARAFRAFHSALSYKHGKSSSYLAVNQMSDWTPEQVDKIILTKDSVAGIEFVPIVSLDELLSKRESEQQNRGQAKPARRKRTSSGELPDLMRFSWENEDSSEPLETRNPFGTSTFELSSDWPVAGSRLLPDAIFTDRRDCLLAAKDQSTCGSCWIFSALALYEWNYCTVFRELVDFSEQYAIDCGTRMGLVGCHGGYFNQLRDFVQEFGVELGSRYPYAASNGQCAYDASVASTSMGLLKFTDKGFVGVRLAEVERYLQIAPLMMVLYLNDKFQEYGGGVDLASGCSDKSVHAVLAVGSGREDGREYWLIRNSFGPNWGQAGHYKLDKRSECILMGAGYLLDRPIVPTARNPNYLWDSIERKFGDIRRANLARSGILAPTSI